MLEAYEKISPNMVIIFKIECFTRLRKGQRANAHRRLNYCNKVAYAGGWGRTIVYRLGIYRNILLYDTCNKHCDKTDATMC